MMFHFSSKMSDAKESEPSGPQAQPRPKRAQAPAVKKPPIKVGMSFDEVKRREAEQEAQGSATARERNDGGAGGNFVGFNKWKKIVPLEQARQSDSFSAVKGVALIRETKRGENNMAGPTGTGRRTRQKLAQAPPMDPVEVVNKTSIASEGTKPMSAVDLRAARLRAIEARGFT